MTVAVTPRYQNFVGSGIAGPFTFNFPILLSNTGVPYIRVTKLDAAGSPTVLSYPGDYSFSPVSLGLGGGIINSLVGVIPADGSRVFVEAVTPLDQAVAYRNQGDFFAETHELSFDKISYIEQEAARTNSLAIRIPSTDITGTTVTLPVAALRANQALVFDASGNATVGSLTTTAISAAMIPVVQASTLFIANKLLQNGNINSVAPAVSDTNVFSQFTTSVNSYAQSIWQNTNAGATASIDLVFGNNSMTSTTFFGNLGMNSSGFTGAGSFNLASAVYLSATSGDLVLGTMTNNTVRFVVNNGSTDSMTINANGAQVPNPTGASATQIANIGTSYGFCFGFVNKFRNGTMDVAQRGANGTITAGSPAYTIDGWIVGSTGANITWAQAGVMSQSTKCIQITGQTSCTDSFIRQRIESSVAAPMQNQQVTVRLQLWNAAVGATLTPTITVKNAASTDNWGAPTTVVNAVSLQPVTSNANSVLAYTFAMPSTAVYGVEVTIDFGSALNANTKYIYLSDFDIRVTPGVTTGLNSNPSPCENRPIASETAFCQRYFCKTFDQTVAPAQNTGSFNGALLSMGAAVDQAMGVYWQFPVTMRAAPTVVTYCPNAATANWTTQAGKTPTVALQTIGTNGVGIRGTTSVLAGGTHEIHATASSEL